MLLLMVSLVHCVSFAGQEPPDVRPLAERVRCSTHVIIGHCISVQTIDESTGKPARWRPDQKYKQCLEIRVIVDEVLDAPHRTFELKKNSQVEVRIRHESLSAQYYRDFLKDKSFIFYVSKTESYEHYFPFWGRTNLVSPLEDREAVEASIAKIKKASE